MQPYIPPFDETICQYLNRCTKHIFKHFQVNMLLVNPEAVLLHVDWMQLISISKCIKLWYKIIYYQHAFFLRSTHN